MTAPSPRDPALSVHIEPPRAWWLRRLPIVLPMLVWVVVALGTLLGFRDDMPPLMGLLGLVCVGIALVVLAAPLLVRSLRELRGTLAVRRVSETASAALLAGDTAAAEARWRSVLHADMSPSARTVVVHNVGLAVLSGGDAPRGAAIMAHARAGGWIDSIALRRHAGAFAQGAALGHVAVGDLDAAAAALEDLAAPPPALRTYVAITHTLRALRGGDGAAAMAAAEGIELTGLPDNAKPLAVLARAWALELGGAGEDAVAAATAEGPMLRPGQPAWAAAHWPELEAAAERLGLVARPDGPDLRLLTPPRTRTP